MVEVGLGVVQVKVDGVLEALLGLCVLSKPQVATTQREERAGVVGVLEGLECTVEDGPIKGLFGWNQV